MAEWVVFRRRQPAAGFPYLLCNTGRMKTCLRAYEDAQSNCTISLFWAVVNVVAPVFLLSIGPVDAGDIAVSLWCLTWAAGYFGGAAYYRAECRRLEAILRDVGGFAFAFLPDAE